MIPLPVSKDLFMRVTVILIVVTIITYSLSISVSSADIQIDPIEMSRNSLKLVTIHGSVNVDIDTDLLISVLFPDGTVQNHTVRVANGGDSFVYFISPGDEFPSGTFVVDVHYMVNSKKRLLDTGAFNIYDADSSFDVVIQRGAGAKACNGCVNPQVIGVVDKSTVTFHNEDSVIHDIQRKKSPKDSIGLIDSDSSKTVQMTGKGIINYYCTIHPWIHFDVNVIPNKYGISIPKQVEKVRDANAEDELDKTSESPKRIMTLDNGKNNGVPNQCTPTCSDGIITRVVDGDTLDIDGTRIRLALVDTPERGESGYSQATKFTRNLCPVGSVAYYDIDKKQPVGPYGRTIAQVFCDNQSLNEQLLLEDHAEILVIYCKTSQFQNTVWAQQYGCDNDNDNSDDDDNNSDGDDNKMMMMMMIDNSSDLDDKLEIPVNDGTMSPQTQSNDTLQSQSGQRTFGNESDSTTANSNSQNDGDDNHVNNNNNNDNNNSVLSDFMDSVIGSLRFLGSSIADMFASFLNT